MLHGAYWALLGMCCLVLLFAIPVALAHEPYAGSFLVAGLSGVASLGSTALLLFRRPNARAKNA
jgi:hypothetical protein